MARKKVALRYIADSTARRESFKTRSNCLVKKAGELATLCDVKACVIVYPEGKSTPQVFSSRGESETVAALNQLRNLEDQHPLMNTTSQESFLGKRLDKLQNQALKCEREREEIETKLLLHRAMVEGNAGLSVGELVNVGSKVEAALKSISDRITKIRGQPPVYQPSNVQVPAAHVTNDMETIGAQAPTPHIANGMNAIGAQAPTAGFNGGMHTVGAQAPPQQEDTWLDLMRTGGDLDAPVYSTFNSGATTSAVVGLNGDEMMQTFNQDAGFVSPWGGPDLGASSSSYFPPM